MKFNQLFILLAFTLFSLGGCFHDQTSSYDISPSVRSLLADRSMPQWSILNSYHDAAVNGELFIIGTEKECASLSSRFLLSDDYDNVDGTAIPDRLPDFAGERIATVVDPSLANVPQYPDSAAVMAFRDKMVSLFFSTLDTLYCAVRFGFERNANKPRAKVILIPSLKASALIRSDVDTLLKASGASVVMISGSEVLNKELNTRFGSGAVSLCLDTIPSDNTPLRAILQNYSASGEVKPISALVIMNHSVSTHDIMAECAQIRNGETWDDFELAKLLDDRFVALDPATLTVRDCFRTLRKGNLFTHDIAYPISHSYQVEYNGLEPILKKKNVQN